MEKCCFGGCTGRPIAAVTLTLKVPLLDGPDSPTDAVAALLPACLRHMSLIERAAASRNPALGVEFGSMPLEAIAPSQQSPERALEVAKGSRIIRP